MTAEPHDEALIANVRNMLRKASQRDSLRKEQIRCLEDPEKGALQITEADKWSGIFHLSSKDGSGILSFTEVQRMVRRYLKLSERVLPDGVLQLFFSIIDKTSDDKVTSHDFLRLVTEGTGQESARAQAETEAIGKAMVMALWREHIYSDQELERWLESHDLLGTGSWSYSEMVRFFREVLRLSQHELPDKRIRSLFKSLEKDRASAVRVAALRSFIKARWQAQGGVPERLTVQVPEDMGGRSCGHGRWARKLDPTGCVGAPFFFNGREVPVRNRSGLGQPPGSATPPSTAETAAAGTSKVAPRSSPPSRPGSAPLSPPTALPLPKRPGSARRQKQPQGGPRRLPSGASSDAQRMSGRPDRCYRVGRFARTMNRIEGRLFEAGIDVRGHLYKSQSSPQLAAK